MLTNSHKFGRPIKGLADIIDRGYPALPLQVNYYGSYNMDVVIPIVFPDYLISVEVARRTIDIIPWTGFDNFRTPKVKSKVANLGHAEVVFIQGRQA